MASTYEPIASQTLGSDTATVTFSGIAASWTDLIIICHGLTSRTASNEDAVKIQFNSDTGSNYSRTQLLGTGSAASSGRNSNQTSASVARMNTSSSSNTNLSVATMSIQSYANTNVYKTILGSSAADQEFYGIARSVSLWRSTSAITTIDLFPSLGPNFKAGSTFSLYGIKAA